MSGPERERSIAIVGFGKIARDQHVPSIEGEPGFRLAATVSPRGPGMDRVPNFKDEVELLRAVPDLDAVAVCTPPGARFAIARACLEAGKHVLLEKPPGATLGEPEELARLAEERGLTLFATWHAQHNHGVDAARRALEGERIRSMRISWREDVRKWHPGQAWIWEPGGFGVFDPGINALSIAAKLVPAPLFVRRAKLSVPGNKQQPIAAELTLASPAIGEDVPVELDWRHSGGERWDIAIRTESGRELLLSEGGAKLAVDGEGRPGDANGEYASIYRCFAELIGRGEREVDLSPLRMVAEAFLLGEREMVEPFED